MWIKESFELFWLLVALNEELLSSLTVDWQEVWVEISRVVCFGLISPRPRILIVKGKLHWFAVLFLVHFKLFWKWSLDVRLNLFDVLKWVFCVVKHLPFLHGSLVHVDLTCSNLFGSHVLFDHALKLDRDILVTFLWIKSTVLSIPPHVLDGIVSMVDFEIITGILRM